MPQFTYHNLSHLSDRLEWLLRQHKASASVVQGKVLPNFVELSLHLAPGIRVNQIKALQSDIALGLGCNSVRVAQRNQFVTIQLSMKANVGTMSVKSAGLGQMERVPVLLSKLLANLHGQTVGEFTCVLGLCEDGLPLMAQLTSPIVSHILVAGATGSGKTTLAKTIVASL